MPTRTVAPPVTLRDLEPGDLGWIVQRHGELYAREYGWDASFEALVARVVADFAEAHDPTRERAWIATAGAERLGAILCVDGGDGVAKLRLLLVEPAARGRGVGTQLVDACVEFARAAGYRELRLWTQAVLGAARRIYARAGFELVGEERVEERFGMPQTSETWRLVLAA